MTSPRDMRLGQLIWPVTYQYEVQAPWGAVHQALTVDVPALWQDMEATTKYGRLLWAAGLAGASTASVACVAVLTKAWASAAVALPVAIPPLFGSQGGSTAPRSRSGCIVLHTSDADGYGRRRLFLPGMPLSWTTEDLLTKAGAEHLQQLARALFIGLADPIGGPEARWLNAYPRMWEGDEQGQGPVGFRYVNHLRVCMYVETAPQAGTGIDV